MHDFLQLTLAQKLADIQAETSYTPKDLNLIGRANSFTDSLVVEEINKSRRTFNEYFPNGDDRNRDCDVVSMNLTYMKLSAKDSELGRYVKATFKEPGSFVGHYKNVMGLNHIDSLA